MMANPAKVVVTTDDQLFHSVHGLCVHHADLPEVQGAGSSPADAAARLAERLARALDNAPSDWRREIVLRAIEDVQAFVRERCSDAPANVPVVSCGDEGSRA